MNLIPRVQIAAQVVTAAQNQLPATVRAVARAVPVCYESRPDSTLIVDGLEADLLGLFVGHEHGAELGEAQPLPPQILLFLDNIWDLAEADEANYCAEVRLTYFHELGHYLGWNEEEIAQRGLE
jgi:predicted Zn-dependent protease with MMP-like domain